MISRTPRHFALGSIWQAIVAASLLFCVGERTAFSDSPAGDSQVEFVLASDSSDIVLFAAAGVASLSEDGLRIVLSDITLTSVGRSAWVVSIHPTLAYGTVSEHRCRPVDTGFVEPVESVSIHLEDGQPVAVPDMELNLDPGLLKYPLSEYWLSIRVTEKRWIYPPALPDGAWRTQPHTVDAAAGVFEPLAPWDEERPVGPLCTRADLWSRY